MNQPQALNSASQPNAAEPGRNIADALADVLPVADVLFVDTPSAEDRHGSVTHVALPKGFTVQAIDNERLLAHPRCTQATALLSDAESFIAYVNRHAGAESVVWCSFDPQTFNLGFVAVIDEHAKALPGWRKHKAGYTPTMSAEWKTWSGNNGKDKAKDQITFAEFLERNESDITSVPGYPTSADMMKMATEFEANGQKNVKSLVRLQGGGVRIDYVDDDTAATVTHMRTFEKFAVGLQVFWAGPGYRIDARLKYRHNAGKVHFWYELIRPDRVHEAAAKELIERVRAGIGATPLLMGASS